MRPFIVPVSDESSMRIEHPCFVLVCLVKGFDLSNRGRASHACDNMLYSVSTAEFGEGRCFSFGWIEFDSSVC